MEEIERTERKDKILTKLLSILCVLPVLTSLCLLAMYIAMLKAKSMPLEESYVIQDFLIKFCVIWILIIIVLLAYAWGLIKKLKKLET